MVLRRTGYLAMGLSADTQKDQPPRPHGKNRNRGPAWHRILESEASPGSKAALAIKFLYSVLSHPHCSHSRATHSFPPSFLFPFFCNCYFLCVGQFKRKNLIGLIWSLLVLLDKIP